MILPDTRRPGHSSVSAEGAASRWLLVLPPLGIHSELPGAAVAVGYEDKLSGRRAGHAVGTREGKGDL